jgi:hypothetical protein
MFGYEAYEVWAELRRLLAGLRHSNHRCHGRFCCRCQSGLTDSARPGPLSERTRAQ